jgi:hypothetical protein
MGDLKTQIGIVVVPAIADLAAAAADFVNTHQQDFVEFFRMALAEGKKFASFARDTVLPTVANLASGAKSLWDSIPGPIRDLLVKGFVADKTIKFLFGIDLAGMGKDLLSDALGAGLRNIFGRGSSPATPMWVQSVGGGVVGPAGAAAGGAVLGGGASRLVQAVSIVSIVGTALAVFQSLQDFMGTRDQAQASLRAQADEAAQQTGAEALRHLQDLSATLGNIQGLDRMLLDTFGSQETATGLRNLSDAITHDQSLTRAQITDAIATLQAAQVQATQHGWSDAAASIGADIATLQSRVATAPEIAAAVAPAVVAAGRNALDQYMQSDAYRQFRAEERGDPTPAAQGAPAATPGAAEPPVVGRRATAQGIAQALHPDLAAVVSGIAAARDATRGAIAAQLPVLALIPGGLRSVSGDVQSVGTSLASYGRDTVAVLRAILARTADVYVTIKPYPVEVRLDGRVIASALTREQAARFPLYSHPGASRNPVLDGGV